MANVTLIPYIGLLTVETRGQGLAAARPRLTLPGLARFPRPAWADVISDRLHLGVDTDVPAWAGGPPSQRRRQIPTKPEPPARS